VHSSESLFNFLPPSAIAPREVTSHRPPSPPGIGVEIDIDFIPRDITPRIPLPPPTPITVGKPLPPPPPSPPAKDADLLNLIVALQSTTRSLQFLNASLGSLAEDMTSIETLLITRELLDQDLARLQPSSDEGSHGNDSHGRGHAREDEHDADRFAGSRKYLRHLYQKYAPRSPTISNTPSLPETPKSSHLRELRLLQSP